MLKVIFCFALLQKKCTYGLGYKLTLTRKGDTAVLNKDTATINAKIKINSIDWYVPHFTPNLPQQNILMKEIVNKIPTELRYVERSVLLKKLITQILWISEWGTQEGINFLIWMFIGFQQSDRKHDQFLKNHIFIRLPVRSAQCNIGTKKYPVSSILLNYDDDKYSQGYDQIKEAFIALTKHDIFQPYISEHDIKSSNDGDNNGFIFYVFDIGYQKKFECPQNK